jgi:BTB/POZ domain
LKDQPLIEATTTIHFPDICAVHFRLLLEFIYKGQVKLQSADHVKGLKELLELLQCDVVQSDVVEPSVEQDPQRQEPTPIGTALVGAEKDQVKKSRRKLF